MAKRAKRRLKVFQAQIGFYDTVVAAPSQAAALRAWGVHQDLFAAGQATVTDDAQAVEAAMARPETPLRRAVGSEDAFALEPAGLPNVLHTAKKPAGAAIRTKPEPRPPKPAADRSALDAAQAALRKLDEDRKREEAALRRRQDELAAERETAQEAYVTGRKAATAAIVTARQAYREAGGKD
jgi:hypothetical protein